MLFNSFDFLIFLVTVFILYWFVFKNSLRNQNILILVSSYIFYGWWDWRFLILILLSTLIDYVCAIQIQKNEDKKIRKRWLMISLFFNLGMLAVFKYFNFFIESWINFSNQLGFSTSISTLNIILPVGISFYTFQTLSYTIDVYRGQLKPTKNFIDFAAFVTFFPQLVAGPIERATNLLPQFQKNRVFDYDLAISGLRLIFWGLLKKVVIADSCSIYVNTIFSNYEQMNLLSLILGGVYFAFQIYGDFSGYSDMAIGTSRLFGFDLMKNFNYPYFSRDIAEFWRRWHISLSTWFRDYLYIPLGGSRGNKINQIRNVFIIFLVSGFWHGANWTFVVWGFINALLFMPLLLVNANRNNINEIEYVGLRRLIIDLVKIIITFSMVCFAWIFFRAENITEAFDYISQMFMNRSFSFQYLSCDRYAVELIPLIFLFVTVEWFSRFKEEPITGGKYETLKLILVLIAILTLGSYSNPQDFIYFQF